MKLNNQAFTLTELLMVVLMIGILSSMLLPKYTKMMDSFRVMEAEQMMRSVRTEQEKRCTLGRQYTTEAGKLSVWSSKRADKEKYTTSNYEYILTSKGIQATSPKNYTLQMLSYLDGRICCDECSGFTKNYMTCAELEKAKDFQDVPNTDACYKKMSQGNI